MIAATIGEWQDLKGYTTQFENKEHENAIPLFLGFYIVNIILRSNILSSLSQWYCTTEKHN